MAFDETLAGRVRTCLADRSDVTERRMFGGLTFLVGGHMCCGVQGDELILRLGPDAADEALSRPHVRPMDFTGRPLTGFVTVGPGGLKGNSLRRWVEQAAKFAESLPPKQTKVRGGRKQQREDRTARRTR
jgi:TfoX/Sxy family transcriptional regulator of competence genes